MTEDAAEPATPVLQPGEVPPKHAVEPVLRVGGCLWH
jgi:hypothetical protein